MADNSNSNDDGEYARENARLREQLEQAELKAQQAEIKAQQAEIKAQQTEIKAQQAVVKAQKTADGSYWNRISTVFGKERATFVGAFDQYKDVRRDGFPKHYNELHNILVPGEGIEAELVELEGESLYSGAEESVVTFDTNGNPKQPAGTEGTKSHQKSYLKTIRGDNYDTTNKSKAHLIPNTDLCNEFWLLDLKLIVGISSESVEDPKNAMHHAARLHTNKLVFGMEHNHYFDTLLYGNILAIPLFHSMEDVGRWEYKEPYEILIVCDSSATYKQLGIIGNEDHVEGASGADVNNAAALLAEATRFLADSLKTNWCSFYNKAGSENDESENRKEVLKNMFGELKEGKVWVPTSDWGIEDDPKVYKVKFGILFDIPEAKKYIPDPLLLLIKAAVNLSAFHYRKNCKLRPACTSLSSEGGEPSEGPINIVTAVPEIRVVSDDESSVCSDLTSYDEDVRRP
ncbi:hypothetical protein IV203_025702 [Nitzschia inconspicua]|uniref:Uncharacterized protein n=1 Tax=Nitzschia inconspicua TaxID=303405 RepID=A0A9K3PWJ7_9STRA|nr:hypothetical protein IV203_025702 [Nitzschia inconspicua]